MHWMAKEKGLIVIPVSAFYAPEHRKIRENSTYVRFCFAKTSETIDNFERLISNKSISNAG